MLTVHHHSQPGHLDSPAGGGQTNTALARRSRSDSVLLLKPRRSLASRLVAAAPAQTDRDLASISEARSLVRRAAQAQTVLAECSTGADRLSSSTRWRRPPPLQADPLARMAVDETGYGVVSDKVQKNLFGSQQVYEFIKPMKTVGVIRRDEQKKVVEIAEPFGVVAAIVPSTNPTSTAIYKILIAIKARCAIVLSPHPSAARCITRTAAVMYDAGRRPDCPTARSGGCRSSRSRARKS